MKRLFDQEKTTGLDLYPWGIDWFFGSLFAIGRSHLSDRLPRPHQTKEERKFWLMIMRACEFKTMMCTN